MTNDTAEKNKNYIELALEDLEQAKESGDEAEICIAHARLAASYLAERDVENGRAHFKEGDQLIEKLGDIDLEAHYLKIKIFAYQIMKHLQEGYKAAERLYEIAQIKGDIGLMSDALADQGHIQLDASAPDKALEKVQQAFELAKDIDDKHRIMGLFGAMGSISLAVDAADRALKHFYQARNLAVELEDKRAEISFTGNIGTLLVYQGDHSKAAEEFEALLENVREEGNPALQVQALRYLCQSHAAMNNQQDVIDYAKQALELLTEHDQAAKLFFYEKAILAMNALEDFDQAQTALQEAIEVAKSMKDKNREVGLMITLGESFVMSEKYEQALETYKKARSRATALKQLQNEAHLVGRIGIVLAEMGELDQAVDYHQRALTMAREREMRELEGEQLVMLAIALVDSPSVDKALDYARQALAVYEDLELLADVEKVSGLIEQIEAEKAE